MQGTVGLDRTQPELCHRKLQKLSLPGATLDLGVTLKLSCSVCLVIWVPFDLKILLNLDSDKAQLITIIILLKFISGKNHIFAVSENRKTHFYIFCFTEFKVYL